MPGIEAPLEILAAARVRHIFGNPGSTERVGASVCRQGPGGCADALHLHGGIAPRAAAERRGGGRGRHHTLSHVGGMRGPDGLPTKTCCAMAYRRKLPAVHRQPPPCWGLCGLPAPGIWHPPAATCSQSVDPPARAASPLLLRCASVTPALSERCQAPTVWP